MDGLGNDFVIIDTRNVNLRLNANQILRLASRENQITQGCDQVIVLSKSPNADIAMNIYNSDGSRVDACGNASRCVAKIIGDELARNHVTIFTGERRLEAKIVGKNSVSVDMGEPKLHWNEIPISQNIDTIDLKISLGELANPVGVSMGNPHAVFFVDDVSTVDLKNLGPQLEHHKLFPERANIGVAQIIDRKNIKLRVWERGAGETKACGTGACAALVAAVRRNLTDTRAVVSVPGGDLDISWDKTNNHVIMTGAVSEPTTGQTEI